MSNLNLFHSRLVEALLHSSSVFKVVEEDLLQCSEWIRERVSQGSVPPLPWSSTYNFHLGGRQIHYQASDGCGTVSLLHMLVKLQLPESDEVIKQHFNLSEQEGYKAIFAFGSLFHCTSPFTCNPNNTLAFRIIRDPAQWLTFILYRKIALRLALGEHPHPIIVRTITNGELCHLDNSSVDYLMDFPLEGVIMNIMGTTEFRFATCRQLERSLVTDEEVYDLSQLELLQYRLSSFVGLKVELPHHNHHPCHKTSAAIVHDIDMPSSTTHTLRSLKYLSRYELELFINKFLSRHPLCPSST
jgi:hypothetical protein